MYRMTRYISIITLLFITNLSFSQTFDATRLQVSWEVLKTDYKVKPAIRAALILTNQSKSPMPASGWKIYLNYGRQVSDVTGNVKWEYINGDLNSIIPTKSFKALLPGQSLRIEYTASGKAINFTDAPSGFYLVWDNQSSKGIPMKKVFLSPLKKENEDGHVSSEMIFVKNESSKDIPEKDLIKIFPVPVFYHKSSGSFKLNTKSSILTDDGFFNEAQLLATDLKNIFGKTPDINSSKSTNGAIILKRVEGLGNEAYQLKVNQANITISATTSTGVFYGIQSLKSMLPPEALATKQQAITLAAVEVSDSSRFAYRAFMMDVARNFQSKEQVLKVLDLMASYKLNVLHFHFNDDEGWRLEIPSLPELTEVGSKRGHTLDSKSTLPASYGSGPDISNPFGTGYYSREDFIHILKYAAERHIRVIPEVETPGHARAAVKSMKARYEKFLKEGNKTEAERYLLHDINDKSVYQSVQKWNDNIMNVAMPSTYAFIEKVVDEIILMYKEAGAPLTTIHLGGDEVPAGSWEKSPAVHALQKSNPQIKSVDDLWYYYFSKVNNMLKSKNLYLSGWEEVALRKTKLDEKARYIPNPDFVNENFHAYVWNNVWGWGSEDLAYRLANAGYKTVLAPVTNFYLDMAYQKDFDELGTYWATYVDIDAPFSFVPFDYYKTAIDNQGKPVNKSVFIGKERLTDFGKSNIVGLQCLLWAETVRSTEQFEYLLTPKILSFAERAWAQEPAWATEKDSIKAKSLYNEDWSRFVNVLGKRELPRLNTLAGGFNYRIPSPGAIIKDGKVHTNIQLPGLQIRYTTNGSEPSISSKLYTGPITEKGTIKIRAFSSNGRGGKSISIKNL